jgi:S-DNA-T family DNA segregation ATPase FtsK/SpoIIIE
VNKKKVKAQERKYLSRSRIAARKKRAARWARLKEILGVALVILTVAAIISLLSHNPQDPSFNAATPRAPFHNYLGSFGAYLSDILVQGLGFGAFFLPLFTFFFALACFVRLTDRRMAVVVRLGGTAIFALSLLGLAGLIFTSDPLFPATPAGGVAGKWLTTTLTPFLNRIGTYLLFTFTLISSLMITTNLKLKTLGTGSWSAAMSLWNLARQRRQIARGRAVKSRSHHQDSPGATRTIGSEPRIVDHLSLPAPSRPLGEHARQEKFDFGGDGAKFELPPLSLLNESPKDRPSLSREELIANSRILERKLQDFGVSGNVAQVHPGPVITMYEFEPAPGVKVNRIVNLADDLALALSALSVRVVAPIPGKAVVGIEIPNRDRETVYLKDLMLSVEFSKSRSRLTIALGKDTFGRPRASDLIRMPHLLIAGATGSGKSVMINSLVCSILFNATPADVLFLMIDPKMVELTTYDGIPHLIAPVVTNPKKAAYALRNAIGIMEERYRILAEKKTRNIESFNNSLQNEAGETGKRPPRMPYLIIVIDELADLMILAQSDVEDSITRLAQLSRAVGIHLMIATQRPSTNVITGIIKANLPVRMSFQVSSKIDSRVILDANGADQLLGKGDMLFLPPGTNKLERIHSAYISEAEVKRLVDYLKKQAQPHYNHTILQAPPVEENVETDGEEDEMYDQAVVLVTKSGQASISYLQRKLRVGYNRAARMIEAMEKTGILSPADGPRPRKILVRRNYQD